MQDTPESIRNAFTILTGFLACGRTTEVSFVVLEDMMWDPEFSAVFLGIPQMKVAHTYMIDIHKYMSDIYIYIYIYIYTYIHIYIYAYIIYICVYIYTYIYILHAYIHFSMLYILIYTFTCIYIILTRTYIKCMHVCRWHTTKK
jgi:hypothetical protein